MANLNQFATVLLAVAATVGGRDAAAGEELVFARNQPATLCIEVIGQLYNGTEEIAGRGSGFFLNDQRSALTGNHIFPPEERYKTIVIKGTVRDDEKPDLVVTLTIKRRDAVRDLALLEADAPVPSRYVIQGDSRKIKPGAHLIVIGCPLTFGPTITAGNLGNIQDDPSGRWLFDAPINPGNSGGPVLTEGGELVGVAWGGIRNTGEGVPIYGLNYVTPIHHALEGVILDGIKIYSAPSPIADPSSTETVASAVTTPPVQAAAAVPRRGSETASSRRAGRQSAAARDNADSRFAAATLPKSDVAPDPPAKRVDIVKSFSRAFEIRQMKDDPPAAVPSPLAYTLKFPADPGYKFIEAKFGELSRNHSSPPVIELSPDSMEITVSFTLTRGPISDPYRGWLHGTLVTRQTRK